MKPYRRIVFVDESGTCRAPMAAGILQEYNIGNSMEIAARGLVVLFPEPLNQKAEAVLISNGITMDGYMSAQITPEDFGEDTLVLTLEEQLRQKLLELFADSDPEAVRVLTEYVGDELEIINPYGGTLQEYGLCYETLNRSLKKLVNLLNNKGE
ncbi:MAG: phosphotyrosine protein phosphatase [Lachnospiraceae bacterium]|nr:phosphotyrosine protein phosphatase [Lachnospiraceae bacterium]